MINWDSNKKQQIWYLKEILKIRQSSQNVIKYKKLNPKSGGILVTKLPLILSAIANNKSAFVRNIIIKTLIISIFIMILWEIILFTFWVQTLTTKCINSGLWHASHTWILKPVSLSLFLSLSLSLSFLFNVKIWKTLDRERLTLKPSIIRQCF